MVKKLHICLNMTLAGAGWMGGVLYIQNLARAIASLPEAERETIQLTLAVLDSNLNLVPEIVRHTVDQIDIRPSWKRATLKLAKILAQKAPFIPTQLLNLQNVDFVYPDLAGSRAPFAWGGWIPDFQHHYLPHLFSQAEIDKRNRENQQIAQAAPVIILSSQMAQQDFNRLYPEAASRSQVMNFSSSPEPEWFLSDPKTVQAKYGLPDEFFLVSNQIWQHKNHGVVIESLGLLKQRGITPTVVCTGNTKDDRNPDYYNQLLRRIEILGIGENLKILGLIPRLDQIQLMRRCLAVIQPSLFEGWSTVVEDARTLGKPILLSDFPVHLEQNPPDSHFFERHNPEQLATLISDALTTLKPGPDLEKETLSRQQNLENVPTYGRRFVEIVRSVVDAK